MALKILKKPGFRLFLLTIPLLALVFIFSYLPLFGWIYAFFDYKPGIRLADTPFVGFKYFIMIFENPIMALNIVRVVRNTLAMSLLGILASPLPIIFAIMLNEIRFKPFRKLTQTLSTIPNFISWILVYAIAWSMFSVSDGFVNRLLVSLGLIDNGINFLASRNNVWLTMLLWQVWKGLGWSAIIYIASIAGIDGELYDAARVDGAGRANIIRHVTVPGLLPTFFVLLLLSIANFLNTGMEQYFVFQNAMNKEYIEVLDLYVYNQGIRGGLIPYSTVVSMVKSLISVSLLFIANRGSRLLRGESIL